MSKRGALPLFKMKNMRLIVDCQLVTNDYNSYVPHHLVNRQLIKEKKVYFYINLEEKAILLNVLSDQYHLGIDFKLIRLWIASVCPIVTGDHLTFVDDLSISLHVRKIINEYYDPGLCTRFRL